MQVLDDYALVSRWQVSEYLHVPDETDQLLITGIINAVSASFETYCNRLFKSRAHTETRDGRGRSWLKVGNPPIISVRCLYDDLDRDYPTVTGKTIAFVDSNPDTITDSGAGFLNASFAAGDSITVVGSTSNDGDYTAAGVVAGTITLVATDSLTAEAAGDDVTVFCDNDNLIDADDYLIADDEYAVQLDSGTFGSGYRNVKHVYEGGFSMVPYDLQLACIEQIAIRYRQSRDRDLGVRSRNLPDGSLVTFLVDDIVPQVKRVLDNYWLPAIER